MRRKSGSMRAIPVSSREVRSYDRVQRNPMGVTRLARVNGPGSASARRSVRAATSRMTPSERLAHARAVVRQESGRRAPAPMRKNPVRASSRPSMVRGTGRMHANAGAATIASARRRRAREQVYASAIRDGLSREGAARRAVRNVPYTQKEQTEGRTFRGAGATHMRKTTKKASARRSVRKPARKTTTRRRKTTAMAPSRRRKTTTRRRKTTTRRRRTAAMAPNRRRKTTTRRRKTTTRRSKARRASPARRRKTTTRRRRTAAPRRRSMKRNSRRRVGTRRVARAALAPNRRRRRVGTRRRAAAALAPNRRRRRVKRRRSMTPNRRRTSRRRMVPNSVMSAVLQTLALGGLATGGFLVHRALTHAIASNALKPNDAGELPLGKYQKAWVGMGVAALGSIGSVLLGNAISGGKKKSSMNYGMAVAAGMIASTVQQSTSIFLGGSENETAAKILPYISGVGRVGRRRRSLGAKTSTMPRYTPIGAFQQAAAGMGAFQQAAAGTGAFMQAAAGMGQAYQAAAGRRGTGEYFVPKTSMGEYFVPKGASGVGSYEQAGPLAMQASQAAALIPIDDGIRPDANMDMVMDLMDSVGGLRGARAAHAARGVGEYLQMDGDKVVKVPRDSQWVPNGALWAGEVGVDDTQAKSTLPAGIFDDTGGNGIFSG